MTNIKEWLEKVSSEMLEKVLPKQTRLEELNKFKEKAHDQMMKWDEEIDSLIDEISSILMERTPETLVVSETPVPAKPKATRKRGRKKKAVPQAVTTNKATPKKPARKKAAQKTKSARPPSIQDLIVEIMKEKRKNLHISKIEKALLEEKKYKTKSKNFSHQLRVLMSQNNRNLFVKKGEGVFNLKK